MRFADRQRIFFFSLLFLFGLVFCSLLVPSSVFAATPDCDSSLTAAYNNAQKLSKKYREKRAITILEGLFGTVDFQQASPECKMAIYQLLVKCYNEIKIIDEKLKDAIRDMVRRILLLNPDFDFQAFLKGEELLAIVEEVRQSLPPPAPQQPQYFDFDLGFDLSKPIKIKAGKTKKLEIATTPQSVAVRFELVGGTDRLFLDQRDSTTALLFYQTDLSEVGDIKSVTVTASTVDTTKAFGLTFAVVKPGSKKWLYWLGGGVAAAGVTFVVTTLIGGSDNGRTKLGDPPPPPGN